MRLRPFAAAVAVPLALTSLAACGESAVQKYAKTAPATIDKDARAAITALKSVHISGSTDDNGTNLALDLSLDTTGNCQGTITAGEQKINIIGLSSGKVFIKTDAAFWERAGGVSAAQAAQMAPKWVTGASVAEFGTMCNLTNFTKSLSATSIAKDKPKFKNTAKVDGVDVVNIVISNQDSSTSIMSVAAGSPHNIMQVADAKGGKAMTFSKFNVPVKPVVPTGAVDIGSVG
jgi:hypothetical protein